MALRGGREDHPDGNPRWREGSQLAAALEVGYKAFGEIAATPAAKEGIGSFLSGEKPAFSGM